MAIQILVLVNLHPELYIVTKSIAYSSYCLSAGKLHSLLKASDHQEPAVICEFPVQIPYTCFGRTTRTWKVSCISPRPAKFKPTNTLCNLKPARVHQKNMTLMRRYACKFLPIEGRELPNIHELQEYLCNT